MNQNRRRVAESMTGDILVEILNRLDAIEAGDKATCGHVHDNGIVCGRPPKHEGDRHRGVDYSVRPHAAIIDWD